MRLKEPYVRRHVHAWGLSFKHSDYGITWDLERECSDCGVKQHTRIDREQKSSLPESVLQLGDFKWEDGCL